MPFATSVIVPTPSSCARHRLGHPMGNAGRTWPHRSTRQSRLARPARSGSILATPSRTLCTLPVACRRDVYGRRLSPGLPGRRMDSRARPHVRAAQQREEE
eukprot:scaffold6249_cov395-Prasinococcus_capsulatus_cf.AAC.10